MIEIRTMRWWDIAQVHELEQRCFPRDTWSIEQFWTELAQPTRRYQVVASDDSIIGYSGIFILAPDSDIQTLAVAEDQRGRGVGRQLLDAAIASAASAGARSMTLEVRADNHAAVTLYESRGFATISRRSSYYPDGSDALILQLRPLVSP